VDLTQLRDIHLPEAVAWWPPAPAWWLLLALLVVVPLLWRALRSLARRRRWRREARAALWQLRRQHRRHPEQGREVVAQLSVVMRRVATTRFPAAGVAALQGESWLTFLDRHATPDNAFRQGAGRLLAVAPYRPSHVNIPEVEALLEVCERWLDALPGGGPC
jgi:hypothetical protein